MVNPMQMQIGMQLAKDGGSAGGQPVSHPLGYPPAVYRVSGLARTYIPRAEPEDGPGISADAASVKGGPQVLGAQHRRH